MARRIWQICSRLCLSVKSDVPWLTNIGSIIRQTRVDSRSRRLKVERFACSVASASFTAHKMLQLIQALVDSNEANGIDGSSQRFLLCLRSNPGVSRLSSRWTRAATGSLNEFSSIVVVSRKLLEEIFQLDLYLYSPQSGDLKTCSLLNVNLLISCRTMHTTGISILI